MNKVEILRGKCEALLEAMNNISNMQHEVFVKRLDNSDENLLDAYITLGEVNKMLRKQYNEYIDELVKLCKEGSRI